MDRYDELLFFAVFRHVTFRGERHSGCPLPARLSTLSDTDSEDEDEDEGMTLNNDELLPPPPPPPLPHFAAGTLENALLNQALSPHELPELDESPYESSRCVGVVEAESPYDYESSRTVELAELSPCDSLPPDLPTPPPLPASVAAAVAAAVDNDSSSSCLLMGVEFASKPEPQPSLE